MGALWQWQRVDNEVLCFANEARLHNNWHDGWYMFMNKFLQLALNFYCLAKILQAALCFRSPSKVWLERNGGGFLKEILGGSSSQFAAAIKRLMRTIWFGANQPSPPQRKRCLSRVGNSGNPGWTKHRCLVLGSHFIIFLGIFFFEGSKLGFILEFRVTIKSRSNPISTTSTIKFLNFNPQSPWQAPLATETYTCLGSGS